VVVPSDLAHVEVHVSTTPGFTPSAVTRVGTITQAGAGGMLPVTPLPYTQHYVRLVGVTTGAVSGAASAETAATPLHVEGPDLAAGSVTAGAIAAGAVEADKLAALLVLASRLVAGDPSAARVELNAQGLRAYNADGEVTVAISAADGSAVFSGQVVGADISGASITGSSLLLGDPDAHHIIINGVLQQYQLSAAADTGAEVGILTHPDQASISVRPPDEPGVGWVGGSIYAYVNDAGEPSPWPAVGLSSPSRVARANSQLQLEGAGGGDRDWTAMTYSADHHQFELGVDTPETHGSIEVAEALAVRAPAHRWRSTALLAQPTGSGNNSVWTDFTNAQFPALSFHTGYSGRVRVTITMCGINTATGGATLSVGFRLDGGSTLEAALARAAMVRARQFAGTTNTYGVQQTAVVYLQLAGDADYTLTPAWRASGSSATWGTDATSPLKFDFSYDTSITVENLM
jgi:hypothetical protein